MTADLKWGFFGSFAVHAVLFSGLVFGREACPLEISVAPASLELALIRPAEARSRPRKKHFNVRQVSGELSGAGESDPSPALAMEGNVFQGIFREASPRAAHNQPPVYPRLARQRGYEGRVLIRACISGEGKVETAEILESSGHDILDESARQAVLVWSFDPQMSFGRPVRSRVTIPVVFRLESSN